MTIDTVLIGPEPRIAVDLAGPEDAPVVLFLHGIGGNRTNWRRQLEALSGRYRAAAWDARGYGGSDDGPDAFAFTDFADDVVRALDHLGADRAHVVGLSMGGRIALDLWRRHPARVRTLTLADTSAGSKETAAPEKVEAFLAARRKPLLEGKTTADIALDVAATLAGPEIAPEVHAELIASLSALRAGPYIRTLEAVTRFTGFPDPATIDVPALIIVGEHDRVAPPHVAQAMADAIPGAEFQIIPGAGHISNLERPDAFDAALLGFLTRHP